MNILATADLHLGKQSSNVPRELRESSVTFTWERIVSYAIDKQIDALLLAGDVVDRDNRFFEAIGPVQSAFESLGTAGIPVVMVSGNHDFDVLPDIIQNREYDHVHLLGENGQWEARTIDTRSGMLQVVGWSFPKQHVMDDPLLQLSVKNLNLDPNLPTVGLLHGDLYDRKSHYAPIDPTGFQPGIPQAWVIGHIHKPDTVRSNNPLVFYPGSPQALSAKEPGMHGPTHLTIASGKVRSRQIVLSPVRYDLLRVDVTGAGNPSDFRNLVTQKMRERVQIILEELERVTHMIFDVELTGRHPDVIELNNWAQFINELEQQMEAETMVSVRKVVNLAEPMVENLEELAKQPTPPGMVANLILDVEDGSSSEYLDELLSELKDELSSANRSATYQPLSRFDDQIPDTEESARKLILKESRQLLGELLSQKDAF